MPGHNTVALRASLSVLGDGFVEAIDSGDPLDISNFDDRRGPRFSACRNC